MSYIGRGIDQIDNISTLDNLSFNGSLQTFNLTQNSVAFVPVSADALQIQIDGVIQANNFTISGSTVTFDFVPSGSSVCNSVKHFGVGLLTTVSDGAITEAKIGSGAVTSSKIASGVIPTSRPNAKSLVFNGNMAISQRGTSFTGKTGVDYYACDRWRTFIGSLGTHTITQEDSNNPTGFGKSYKILTTTANASPSGTNYLYLRQSLEGNDVQLLKYGTSDAVKLTAGFWVKSNKTGTFGVETQCLSGGTSYERTEDITINSADTWEFKTFVVPANTSNAIDDGNGQSYNFYFWINAGTDYIGTPHANWGNQSNSGRAGTSTLGVGETVNDYFQLTGVQFEVGEYTSSTIPPFQHESFGDNIIRCQRYFQQFGSNSSIYNRTPVNGHAMLLGARDVGGNANWTYPVLYQPVPLRDNPTVSHNNLDFWSGGTAYGISGLGGNQYAGFNALEGYVSGTTFSENVVLLKINGTSDTYLRFDSEL